VAELFFDTGLGFTPRQVLRQVVFGEERLLEFDLSAYGRIGQVRFHPMNAPLALHLNRIETIDEQGCSRILTPGQSNALWTDGSHWIFRADHPWMTVDLSGVENPRKLSIHFHYLAIGAEVYPEILKVKEQEGVRMLQAKEQEVNGLRETIRQKSEIIQELMNSTSWRLTRPLRRLKEMLKP
jgi:hypothetical protein